VIVQLFNSYPTKALHATTIYVRQETHHAVVQTRRRPERKPAATAPSNPNPKEIHHSKIAQGSPKVVIVKLCKRSMSMPKHTQYPEQSTRELSSRGGRSAGQRAFTKSCRSRCATNRQRGPNIAPQVKNPKPPTRRRRLRWYRTKPLYGTSSNDHEGRSRLQLGKTPSAMSNTKSSISWCQKEGLRSLVGLYLPLALEYPTTFVYSSH